MMTDRVQLPEGVKLYRPEDLNGETVMGKASPGSLGAKYLHIEDLSRIRDEARKQALLGVAEELTRRSEGLEDDIREEQLGEYDTEVIRSLRGEGRGLLGASALCRELAEKEGER